MGKSGILIEFEAFKKRHMKTHPELPMQEAKNKKPWLTTEEVAPTWIDKSLLGNANYVDGR